MITAVSSAKNYDWSDWLVGIMRAFLSGGAGALVALGGSTVLQLSLKQTLLLTGSQFLIMGLYRLGEFLQLNGAPSQIQKSLDVAADAAAKTSDAIATAQSQVANSQTPKT